MPVLLRRAALAGRGANPRIVPAGPVEFDPANAGSLAAGLLQYHVPGARLENLAPGRLATLSRTATGLTWTAAPQGPVAQLDGATGALSTSDAGLPTGAGTRSLAVWFRWTGSAIATTANYSLISYGTNANTNGAYLYLTGTAGAFGAGCVSASQYGIGLETSGRCDDGAWHHAVATFDGTSWRVYVDGVFKSSANMTTNTIAGGTFWIGHDTANATWVSGQIDNVGLWNRTLSATEVQQLYRDPFVMLRPARPRKVFSLPPLPPPARRPFVFVVH